VGDKNYTPCFFEKITKNKNGFVKMEIIARLNSIMQLICTIIHFTFLWPRTLGQYLNIN
jgi:hypothetical protein